MGSQIRIPVLFLLADWASLGALLFEPPQHELSDQEIAEVLLQAMGSGGRLSRMEHLYTAGISAEHLVERLRAAGLRVIRPEPPAG